MSTNSYQQEIMDMEDVDTSETTAVGENLDLENGISPSNKQLAEKRLGHLKLYRAAIHGDWKNAEKICEDYKIDITAKISKKEDTALHIAVTAKRSTFVKKLLENLPKGKMVLLELKSKGGDTPFCLAAACGNVKLAKLMMDKVKEQEVVVPREKKNDTAKNESKNLAMIPGRKDLLPLEMAALFGHKEMVKYLYEITAVESLDKDRCLELLLNMISNGLYDVALGLVKKIQNLATAPHQNDQETETLTETALHALARMPIVNKQGFWKSCFNLCRLIFLKKKPDPEAAKLIKRLWEQVIVRDNSISDISKSIGMQIGRKLIFVAAKQGNTEFLTILIREYPDLVFEKDDKKNKYTIFHYAVKYRHNDIFKLIHKIGSIKGLIAPFEDKKGNNILHLAGILAPPDRRSIVSGAALQLQRELLWFEEVRKIMHPLDAQKKNKKGKTPEVLFSEQHENLKKEGEKWMKVTASSCMIVATLIATVAFAAAFATPGGTKQDTGTPNFLLKDSFIIFAIADAVSLVLSSCSVLTFLSILTSRYAEEDFIWWLPTKLFIGLLTLFLSIVALMVVFCTTFFIVFNERKRWCAYLVTGIASGPAILYIILESRLICDIVSSTYRRSALFKPRKHNFSFKEE